APTAPSSADRELSFFSPRCEQQLDIGLHHFANVERLETFEQSVPDNRDQARRRNNLRKIHETLRNFTARRGTSKERPNSGNNARQHFAVIEFGKLRKAPAFRNHQADNVLAPGLVDFADKEF